MVAFNCKCRKGARCLPCIEADELTKEVSMRKPLHTPVVENSEGPSEDQARRTFTVGQIAFPGVGNPTGYITDRLKRRGRR